jgi:signal transduction histidine kinase
VKDYPLVILHRSGRITHVLYNARVYKDEGGAVQGVFAAARDITELKKAEEIARESERKLRDAERLAAIGATAGMVGHDIRNPLQAIIGDLYLLNSDISSLPRGEAKESMGESIKGIEANVEYVNKIVQDLQDFAKPIKPIANIVDTEDLFNGILFKNGVPDNVDAACRVAEDAKKIVTDPNLLKRILSNLVNNAVQAMPKGGKLTLHAFREAGDVVITVQDTGIEIPEESKSQLFIPLFTTKSRGQGFGLAVVKRVTEVLGGTVIFESEVGKGTTFIIRFPSPKEIDGI